MPNDFHADLNYSHSQSDDPMWLKVYAKAFPTLKEAVPVPADGWAQRGGIDRVLVLGSGKTLYVDEKVRRKDYGDILLEYKHEYKRGGQSRGWVAKDLACDYIAYGVIPSKKCYLLPFHQLRLAWKNNRKRWVGEYKTREADNRDYVTINCPVPVPVLLSAMSEAVVIDWAPDAV